MGNVIKCLIPDDWNYRGSGVRSMSNSLRGTCRGSLSERKEIKLEVRGSLDWACQQMSNLRVSPLGKRRLEIYFDGGDIKECGFHCETNIVKRLV